MFRIENLGFKYDSWVFQNSSCTIRCKKVGIIGVNGIGKTTLLRLLSGDLKPDMGVISLSADTYLVNFMEKNYMYFTARELFSLCLSLQGFENTFDNLSDIMNFDGMLDTCLQNLSLGSLKKVFLMLGFASVNRIILLDEPFENLDEDTNANLVKYISSCDKEMVIVSHNKSLLKSCTDEIYEIRDRKLVKI